ncbi:hypothetical protein, partial [Enterococcus faecium]|uniref:hypothetical protein n=1 Tax=Enterococcus faecium TaxID=1352 RepID=UPI002931F3B7
KFEQKNKLTIEVENQIGKGLTGDYKGRNYRIGKPTSFDDVSDTRRNGSVMASYNKNMASK